MRSEDDRGWLKDIHDNILFARQFIGSMSRDEFVADRKAFYATTRALEIISEASRHLSESLKGRHPSIDWVAVRDAGNVYRHGYEYVTEERIWDTATKSLSALDAVVREELTRS
jgi:uncharacterized protein with HEPN domain